MRRTGGSAGHGQRAAGIARLHELIEQFADEQDRPDHIGGDRRLPSREV